MRAILEIKHLSKDCEVAKSYSKKGYSLKLDSQLSLIAGFVHLACGDNSASLKFLGEHLSLSPVDTGYMATHMYAANLFILKTEKEMREFIGDKINNDDMWGTVYWYYAYYEIQKGNLEKARELLKKGKENGALKKWIAANLRNPQVEERLTKTLETLGPLE